MYFYIKKIKKNYWKYCLTLDIAADAPSPNCCIKSSKLSAG